MALGSEYSIAQLHDRDVCPVHQYENNKNRPLPMGPVPDWGERDENFCLSIFNELTRKADVLAVHNF